MHKLTTLVIATAFGAGTALAGEAPEFTAIDKDKDGFVSREEARAAPDIMEIFARVDQDEDDQLSTAEYTEAVKQLQG
jgi:Ca2+-binding EF-hand superfamily protein